jgi:hypothetical protein
MARLPLTFSLPAGNRHLSFLLVLMGVAALLIEARALPSRELYLAAALPTVVAVLVAVAAASRAGTVAADRLLARLLVEAGRSPPGAGGGATRFATLFHALGILGAVLVYGVLALTPSNVVATGDESFRWGFIDKRPQVFGYLFVAALIAFHWVVAALSSEVRHAPPARQALPVAPPRSALERFGGAVLVTLIAFVLFCLPILRDLTLLPGSGLAGFFELHSHVHLAALEQIRLGATPYLEASTQYGLGNQLLMYALTRAIDFSNHGFNAAVVLIAVACILVFFLAVQQLLGTGWAIAAMVGWLLWPAPFLAVDLVPGWAILTRWVAIPILALIFARLLLTDVSPGGSALGWIVAGALWGLGGFLSQENLTGGLLVLALCMALFAPMRRGVGELLRAGSLFVASGALVFVLLTGSAVGFGHVLDVLRIANGRSGLVTAGVSNSFWSNNLEFVVGFRTINGWYENLVTSSGDSVRPVLQTYGFALLLMLVLGLVARGLARRFASASATDRQFLWKFAGVVAGSYVLHLFTLLRSDLPHLAAPSFLLPLVLIMLPVFAWRFLRPGLGRSALLAFAVALFVEAIVAARPDTGRRVDAIAGAVAVPGDIVRTYAGLFSADDRRQDLAERYSPLGRFQTALRSHADYEESREFFELLHERLKGRRLEVGFYRAFNGLIQGPEAFYFFGGFRSISGMTSPHTGIWLRSEERAWIDRVARASGCVFFGMTQREQQPLLEAWKAAAARTPGTTTDEIAGRRLYGTLACKG